MVEILQVKGVWKFIMMEDGTPYVMMNGAPVMPSLLANNWATTLGNLLVVHAMEQDLAELL